MPKKVEQEGHWDPDPKISFEHLNKGFSGGKLRFQGEKLFHPLLVMVYKYDANNGQQ